MTKPDATTPLPSPTAAAPRARKKKRVRKPKRERSHGGTVEARIAHIVGMMRDLTFLTGKTVPILAKKWGLHPDTVSEYAAEASRTVRASAMGDRDSISATIGAALDKAIHSAVSEKNWRVVAQLADTWAKIAGVVAPVRTEVTAMIGSSATPSEARKVMRELFPGAVGPDAETARPEHPSADGDRGPAQGPPTE